MSVQKNHNYRNSRKRRERSEPRISLNKLGEYAAESKASRRRRIIRDQKRPKDFIVPYYDPAREALVNFIAEGEQDTTILKAALAELEVRRTDSQWKEQRASSCADALTAFATQFSQILEQGGLTARAVAKNTSSYLRVNGVRVSVRPDLLVSGKDGKGKQIAGAIKLHLSKGRPLNRGSGCYVATFLHKFVEEQVASENQHTSRKRCFVLDVFEGRRFSAPRSHIQRRKDLAHACNEISAIWPLV